MSSWCTMCIARPLCSQLCVPGDAALQGHVPKVIEAYDVPKEAFDKWWKALGPLHPSDVKHFDEVDWSAFVRRDEEFRTALSNMGAEILASALAHRFSGSPPRFRHVLGCCERDSCCDLYVLHLRRIRWPPGKGMDWPQSAPALPRYELTAALDGCCASTPA